MQNILRMDYQIKLLVMILCKAQTLIRQLWLSNYFYGGIFSLQYKYKKTQFTFGGGWDKYDGKHYGIITWAQNGGIPPNYKWYNEPAYKTDFNVYAKLQQELNEKMDAFC